jgi:hypothetical protein
MSDLSPFARQVLIAGIGNHAAGIEIAEKLDGAQAADPTLDLLATLEVGGNALKLVRVNAGGTAFELATGGGGGGLTNFTDTLADAAPNDTVPVATLSAYGAAADIDLAIVAKGYGAIVAEVPDNSYGGNKRGQCATDLQHGPYAGYGAYVASGYASVIAGGGYNTASGANSVVSGGSDNTASGANSVVSGGSGNTASGATSVMSGGNNNTASNNRSVVSGGQLNTASNDHSVVSGGFTNTASGTFSAVSGGKYNTASGAYSAVSGGFTNTASGNTSVVGGGNNNTASGDRSVVSGGFTNTASGTFSTVSGGAGNTASGDNSVVSGGTGNTASNDKSVVSGGNTNTASGAYSVVSGGYNNTASGAHSVVSGGFGATTRGLYGMSAIASGRFAADGDAQEGGYRLRKQTTDATPTYATADAGAQSATNQPALPNNSAYAFRALVIAHRTDAVGTRAVYSFVGGIKRDANAASTALLTVTKTVVHEDDAAYDCDIEADTTNGALAVKVTGKVGHSIQWVAKIETIETVGG